MTAPCTEHKHTRAPRILPKEKRIADAILREWDFERNGSIDPRTVTRFSSTRLWWRCADCGCSWQAPPNNRSRGSGCPRCGVARRRNHRALSIEHPLLAAEWDTERNGDLTPDMVKSGTKTRVWWRCLTCDHSWQASVANRTLLNSGCPECSMVSRIAHLERVRVAVS